MARELIEAKGKEAKEEVKREIEILDELDHKNILHHYETHKDDINIYVVLEYCDGGNLLNLI